MWALIAVLFLQNSIAHGVFLSRFTVRGIEM